jgi:hypothetical protein
MECIVGVKKAKLAPVLTRKTRPTVARAAKNASQTEPDTHQKGPLPEPRAFRRKLEVSRI